jgi:hypothetical protein
MQELLIARTNNIIAENQRFIRGRLLRLIVGTFVQNTSTVSSNLRIVKVCTYCKQEFIAG